MKRQLLSGCLAGAILAAGGVVQQARGEEIVLKNGSHISGTIRMETDDIVTLNRHGQDIALNKRDIDSIDRAALMYYVEEFQQAFDADDQVRLKRLLNYMSRHEESAVRDKALELQDRLEFDETSPKWVEERLELMSLDELHKGFRGALDKVQWDRAINYGREMLKRQKPDVEFFASMLEALKNTRRDSQFLIMDTYRLLMYSTAEDARVAQVYLLSAIEDRMITLWDPERPTRADSEIYILLIVRGILLNLPELRDQESADRITVEQIFSDLTTTDDWDYAMREMPSEYTLLIFSQASHARTELIPIFRYFAILKEPEILAADAGSPLLNEPMREARGIYIYAISGVSPLPREKLWASARDLAIITQSAPPRVSDIMNEVFAYTPEKQHMDLAMSYEDLLVTEGLSGRDTGEGLKRALGLIAKRRCGTEFNKVKSWDAFKSLAIVGQKANSFSAGNPSLSQILEASFSVASNFEKEKICMQYEDRLIKAAREGEKGDGLLEAVSVIATKRCLDTSTPETKWNAFEALAQLRRNKFDARLVNELTKSEVMDAVFAVCPDTDKLRVCVLFEESLIDTAISNSDRGPGLIKSVRMLAAHRADDLSDSDASWRSYKALAIITSPAPANTPVDPSVSEIIEAGLSVAPAVRQAQVCLRFEDLLVNAVLEDGDRGRGVDRAIRTICQQRISTVTNPLATWRAFEVLALLDFGKTVSPEDVFMKMEAETESSLTLRANALEVASAIYREPQKVDDPIFLEYHDKWVNGLITDLRLWIDRNGDMKSEPVPNLRISEAVLIQATQLREMLAEVRRHTELLRDLDRTETLIKSQFRPGREASDSQMTSAVLELNDYLKRTRSSAVRQRIIHLVESSFDEAGRNKLLEMGLELGNKKPASAQTGQETGASAPLTNTPALKPGNPKSAAP